MFRAVPCSSSGGQFVSLQPLVSSLSVNSRTVCRLRAEFLYSITIYMLHYNPQHVSSCTLLIFRRKNCIITASGIIILCKRPYSMPVESGLQSDRFPLNSLDFPVTYSFRPYHGPGVDSAPSENVYQEHFLGVKAAGA